MYDIEEDEIKKLMTKEEFFENLNKEIDMVELEHIIERNHTINCELRNNNDCRCKEEQSELAKKYLKMISNTIVEGIEKEIAEREKKFEEEIKEEQNNKNSNNITIKKRKKREKKKKRLIKH